jgi:hypothetical protein
VAPQPAEQWRQFAGEGMTLEASYIRDEKGRFPQGSISPGRAKGSRNKLGEQFWADLYQHYCEKGSKCFDELLEKHTYKYFQIIANGCPKEIDIAISGNVNLLAKIENFNHCYQFALEHIGAKPSMLEAEDLDPAK